MNEEELNGIESLDIVLNDVDDLDMGLEVISYKARVCIQELSKVVMEQSSQLQAYKAKEEKTKQIFINLLFKLGELNMQYKDNKSDDYGIRTQDYLELYKILNEGSEENE